jgi:hypothetical protein
VIHKYPIHLKLREGINKVSLKIIFQTHLKWNKIHLQRNQRDIMKVKFKYNKIKMTIINQKVAIHFLPKTIFQRVMKKAL